MKKVKAIKNDKVIAFDFYANLLEHDKMYKLCELFSLNEIYVDIYGASNRINSFTATLLEKNTDIFVAQIDNSYGIAIKATIKNIPMIAEILSGFDFDEMNIWDCYTGWEQYLKDKSTKMPFFTIKPIKVESDSKFYLNYNLIEGQKVEIICDTVYDDQELFAKIQNLVINQQKDQMKYPDGKP